MPAINTVHPGTGDAPSKFDLKTIRNLDVTLDRQVHNFNQTRQSVRGLRFVPVDPVGTYSAVSYKAIDGGKLGIYFDPFEVDLVKVADSYGNEPMAFLVPTAENQGPAAFEFLHEFPEVQTLLQTYNATHLKDITQFLQSSQAIMQIAEFACILERLARDRSEPILLMKDGLLRNALFKPQTKPQFYDLLRQHRQQKVVAVAKRSKVLGLIGAALWAERIIPPDVTGYVEIPREIEDAAYQWHQQGFLYQYGKLYIAKLSPQSDLLVTIEIPYDWEQNEPIYSTAEVDEIIGHLVKDSRFSFPTIGYPQTIMRAHEKAVAAGFTASIWRDLIMDELLKRAGDVPIQGILRELWLLKQQIKYPQMGGT